MAWSITSDIHEFLDVAGDWLRSRPATTTVLLSVSEELRADPSGYGTGVPPALGWWTAQGTVAGAFLHTPPHPVEICTADPGSAASLAAALAEAGRPVTTVSSADAVADAFAHEWLRRHPGSASAVATRQRLYRLTDLVEPDTPGRPRPATTADRDLLIAWRRGFLDENPGLPAGDLAAAVDRTLAYGGSTLWTVDGSPVSMASLTRPAGGMVRVGNVYTPPPLRRRGYAAAVVAQVSRDARTAGTPEVVLFTDLANPTSNSVYQRLGFRPVEDRVVLDLRSPT